LKLRHAASGTNHEAGLDARKVRPYVQKREKQMSERLRRAILQIAKEMKANEPAVRKLFEQNGAQTDPAIVYSALKYHKTLKKLAKE